MFRSPPESTETSLKSEGYGIVAESGQPTSYGSSLQSTVPLASPDGNMQPEGSTLPSTNGVEERGERLFT